MKHWLALVGVAFALLGCNETTVRIKNDLPGVVIENPRWIPDSEPTFEDYREDRVLPGRASRDFPVAPEHEGTGIIHFEMVVNGTRVSLVTKEKFSSQSDRGTTFVIDRQTAVTNPVWDGLFDK